MGFYNDEKSHRVLVYDAKAGLFAYDSMVQGDTAGQTRLHYRNRGCKGAQNRVGAYRLVGQWNGGTLRRPWVWVVGMRAAGLF